MKSTVRRPYVGHYYYSYLDSLGIAVEKKIFQEIKHVHYMANKEQEHLLQVFMKFRNLEFL